jgi:hypothetical protein
MTENRADLSHNLRSQTSTEAHLKASRYRQISPTSREPTWKASQQGCLVCHWEMILKLIGYLRNPCLHYYQLASMLGYCWTCCNFQSPWRAENSDVCSKVALQGLHNWRGWLCNHHGYIWSSSYDMGDLPHLSVAQTTHIGSTLSAKQ